MLARSSASFSVHTRQIMSKNRRNDKTSAGWLAGLLVGWLDGWLDGWTDGWLVGWLAGWMDGWMDEVFVYVCTSWIVIKPTCIHLPGCYFIFVSGRNAVTQSTDQKTLKTQT